MKYGHHSEYPKTRSEDQFLDIGKIVEFKLTEPPKPPSGIPRPPVPVTGQSHVEKGSV